MDNNEINEFSLYFKLGLIQSQAEALKNSITENSFTYTEDYFNEISKIIDNIGHHDGDIIINGKTIWKKPIRGSGMIHIYGPACKVVRIEGGVAFPGTAQWYAEQAKLNPEEREQYRAFTESVAGGLGKIMMQNDK